MNAVDVNVPVRNVKIQAPPRKVVIEVIRLADDQTFYSDDQPNTVWEERT